MRSGLVAAIILAIMVLVGGCASIQNSLDDPFVFAAVKAGVEYGVAVGTYDVLQRTEADALDAKFVEALFGGIETYLREGKITAPAEVEAMIPAQYKALFAEGLLLAERLAKGKPDDPKVKEILLSAVNGGQLGAQSYQRKLEIEKKPGITARLINVKQ